MVNLGIGAAVLLTSREQLGNRFGWLAVQAGLIGLGLVGLLAGSGPLLDKWESALYYDRIVYSGQSPYQKIVLTRRGDQIRLFLDGHLQFASTDEYRYHEALVHPAMSLAASRERVLIVGGGDGLAAREVLKYPDVARIDLVDLDPAVTGLARTNPHLSQINEGSLDSPRVRIFNEDGFVFLQRDHSPYGVILVDLPDPREESLSKLYSVEAYRMFLRNLSPGGVLVTQATSPYFARRTYWCIARSMEEAGFQVYSYHLQVPSFGEWGFHLGSLARLEPEKVVFRVPRRFLDERLFRAMFLFDPDMARVQVAPNRLDRPVLARYYRQEWSRW